jgi:RHS repeat-associated protein
VVEYDNSGNILRRYVPGAGTDETLVWYEGAGTSSPAWLHTDEQGTTIATTSGGATATPYVYSPTGEPTSWGSVGSAPAMRYTGQVALPQVQLMYFKARMYDPALGRFLQTDPAGYSAGMNLYAYVMNNYPNASDPSGLFIQCYGYHFYRSNNDPSTDTPIEADYCEDVSDPGSTGPDCSHYDTAGPHGECVQDVPAPEFKHKYLVSGQTDCTSIELQDVFRAPGMSAPFAPEAIPGVNPRNLAGNPITQDVRPFWIQNVTGSTHEFCCGSVNIMMSDTKGGSAFTITGVGNNKSWFNSKLNEFAGKIIFQNIANQAKRACAIAHGRGGPND